MPSIHWLFPTVAVVNLEVEHTLASDNFAAIRQLLFDLAGRCDRLIVDFSSTRMFDGAFLGVLAAAWVKMGRRRSAPTVCGLDQHGSRVLQICHLDLVWTITPSHPKILGYPGSRHLDDAHSIVCCGPGATAAMQMTRAVSPKVALPYTTLYRSGPFDLDQDCGGDR